MLEKCHDELLKFKFRKPFGMQVHESEVIIETIMGLPVTF